MLFRLPSLNISLIDERGNTTPYRFVAPTAEEGLLINYAPPSGEDLALLFARKARHRTVAFRIDGEGADYYVPMGQVSWAESTDVIQYDPDLSVDISHAAPLISHVEVHVDGAGTIWQPANGATVDVEPSSRGQVSVFGWALDKTTRAPVKEVTLLVDGATEIQASYGISRPDIAGLFHNSGVEPTGFQAVVDTRPLARGSHTVTLQATTSDGQIYSVPSFVLYLDVH